MSSIDEAMTALPTAYRGNLIMIALTKRALLSDDLTPAQRVYDLEWLDRHGVFGAITVEMMQMVEPANDAFSEIAGEALKVDHGSASFAILERDDVFRRLLQLNSGMVRAIQMCRRAAA